jgi:Gas vesicle protein K
MVKRKRRAVRTPTRRAKHRDAAPGAIAADAREIEELRKHLEHVASHKGPPRWNANPDDVQRSVIQLVLTLVEFIRKVLERQAIRRVENDTLTPEQIEAVGLALMRLEETIRDIAAQFNLSPADLNLDLGSFGKLM